jgi:hypothetical protein
MSTCFFLLHQLTYIQSAQPSPYILWRVGSSGACPQTCRPDIALVRAARLPGPTRRALSGMLAIARNNVRTRVIESLVHTPLVIDEDPVHSVVLRKFRRLCPLPQQQVINQLTVPTAGMSACKSSYRKKLVGR